MQGDGLHSSNNNFEAMMGDTSHGDSIRFHGNFAAHHHFAMDDGSNSEDFRNPLLSKVERKKLKAKLLSNHKILTQAA